MKSLIIVDPTSCLPLSDSPFDEVEYLIVNDVGVNARSIRSSADRSKGDDSVGVVAALRAAHKRSSRVSLGVRKKKTNYQDFGTLIN